VSSRASTAQPAGSWQLYAAAGTQQLVMLMQVFGKCTVCVLLCTAAKLPVVQ
jgi:hypothetical protein